MSFRATTMSSNTHAAVHEGPQPIYEHRDWSWLGVPGVPFLLGSSLAALEITADENMSRPFEGVVVIALCLLTVLVLMRTASGRSSQTQRPKAAAILWLIAVPGVALWVAIAGSASLAAFLLLPAMAVGYGLSDFLRTRWPAAISAALVVASIVTLIARLGITPAFAQVVPAAVAAALLLALGLIAIRVLSASR